MSRSDMIIGVSVWLQGGRQFDPGIIMSRLKPNGRVDVDIFGPKDGEWEAVRDVTLNDFTPRGPYEKRETVQT